ncbi:MAG: thiamine phosphate synthase [Pseudomonadota bacterium]
MVIEPHHTLDHLAPMAGTAAAAVVAGAHSGLRDLVAALQSAGAAVLVDAEAADTAGIADGVHVGGSLEARQGALRSRGGDGSVGVTAQNRHEAMLLGEAGADYIWFEADSALSPAGATELCAWWSALFEVPAVMAGPLSEVEDLCATGADFIAVTDLLDQRDGAAALSRVLAALGEAAH